MYKRSIKRTLFIYLAYAWLVSSILSAAVLLIEYSPSTQKAVQRFGVGALVLDCILWEFVFTITGALSLFNIYPGVRKNLALSLSCFIVLPAIALVCVLLISQRKDLFGATETAIVFLLSQVFFFSRFRRCVREKSILSFE